MKTWWRFPVALLACALLVGCGPGGDSPAQTGGRKIQVALFVGKLDVANARERQQGIAEVLKEQGVEIAETFTDQHDRGKCQEYVRTALDKYGDDLKCLVGLWSYNPPAIVQVVKEKGMAGKISIVAFDEEIPTLDAVADGTIYSTIVQQPFEFGYRSTEVLHKLARKEPVEIPQNGLMYVPVKVINQETVQEFRATLKTILASREDAPAEGKEVKLAFVTNGSSDFWTVALAGVRKAERDFNVQVDFQQPGQGTAEQQQKIIETLLSKDIQGMAVSVLDPVGSISILNKVAERMPVVTQDSDAPDSKRTVYIGTDNVEAGRIAGREILKALAAAGVLPKK